MQTTALTVVLTHYLANYFTVF